MLIAENTRISAYDAKRWIITPPTGRHLLVNEAGARLFEILRAAATVEQAHTAFNHSFQSQLDAAQFGRLVAGSFGGYALLEEDTTEQRPQSEASYIAWKVQLLSAEAAGRLAAPLRRLYAPGTFWWLFAGHAAFLGTVCGQQSLMPAAGMSHYLVVVPLLYGSVLLHELGHIAACARLGIRHGGVGFGFYGYVFPVLFADITGIWQATRHQRMIANLAGIFAQLLVASPLALAYLSTGYHPLLLAAVSISVSALWQCNPFVRRDGYWMLSDLTNTPNLLPKAAHALQQAVTASSLRRVISSRGRALGSKKVLLALYGAANSLLFVGLVTYSLLQHGPAIAALPAQLPALLSGLLRGTAEFTAEQLLAAGFYGLLTRFLISTYTQRRATQRAPMG